MWVRWRGAQRCRLLTLTTTTVVVERRSLSLSDGEDDKEDKASLCWTRLCIDPFTAPCRPPLPLPPASSFLAVRAEHCSCTQLQLGDARANDESAIIQPSRLEITLSLRTINTISTMPPNTPRSTIPFGARMVALLPGLWHDRLSRTAEQALSSPKEARGHRGPELED